MFELIMKKNPLGTTKLTQKHKGNLLFFYSFVHMFTGLKQSILRDKIAQQKAIKKLGVNSSKNPGGHIL